MYLFWVGVSTECFFYFGMFDIVIFWLFFEQKSCFWTFFISTFRSYFVKKKLQNIRVITFHSIIILEKLPILDKFSKIITFLKNLQQNCCNFTISTNIFIKIASLNSKHGKQYKKYQKKFYLILKLGKNLNFLIKKWKKWAFSKPLKWVLLQKPQ